MLIRSIVLSLILAATSVLLAPDTNAAPVEIHLAHTQRQTSASDPVAVTAATFKRLVEQGSDGAVVVRMHPDSRLGGNREMAKLVDRNIIQSAFITVGGITPLYLPISVTQLPFAIPDRATAYAIFDGAFGERLVGDIRSRTRFEVLGFAEPGGFHIIANSMRPVSTPGDVAGLKIRAIPGFASLDAMIRALGAKPVKVASREEFSALTSGVVDGVMSPASSITARGFDAVLRHATLTNHLYSPYAWLFNKEALEALPPEQRQLIRTAAREAIGEGRKSAEAWENSGSGLGQLRQKLKARDLNPAERQAFAEATQPAVKARLAKELGPDGSEWIERFLAAIQGDSAR
jgi:TRAP-type C4-dicarboxylate transport system substrate-binding protein